MKANDLIHGFRVKYLQEIPEIKATLVRMTYEKNGADLVWLDREDENKTFSVAFKTVPQDDTGVFHILEHSVLCGSQQYPVKEPFVELLKGSLQTFLNAMTGSDKTIYPLSTRNDKDFLNLISVYMDAVLHPLSVTDPHSFRQEGWHYEIENADDELKYNGVVYNEMKGAFASADTLLANMLCRKLFPDTCYRFESGGDPEHIPELTFEQYKASHERFYHPSNAYFFLDGSIQLDNVLQLLDNYLCTYEQKEMDIDIPLQKPVSSEETVGYYEVDPDENDNNKALLARAWVYADCDDALQGNAFSALAALLCGSNEAPLKKALLSRGLAEDVEFQTLGEFRQKTVLIVVRNADPTKRSEIWKIVEDTLQEQASGALNREHLRAIMRRNEFLLREMDSGSLPKGIIFALTALNTWLYNGEPSTGLCFEKDLQDLYEGLEGGYFEKIIRESILDNSHMAQVCLLPSKTLGEQKKAAEMVKLKAIKDNWSEEQVQKEIESFASFRERLACIDTPEAVASIPMLSLSDIPERTASVTQEIHEIQGVTVLHQKIDTQGIVYLSLYFDLDDQKQEEVGQLSVFSSLLGSLPTAHYSLQELKSECDSCLGGWSTGVTLYVKEKKPSLKLYVKLSLLESSKPDAIRLIREILQQSDFSAKELIAQYLKQNRTELEQATIMAGDSIAAVYALATQAADAALADACYGISKLRWLQQIDRVGDVDALCERLSIYPQKLFSIPRLTIAVTGSYDPEWLKEVIHLFTTSFMGQRVSYQPVSTERTGFRIPADIGFAALVSNKEEPSAVTGVSQTANHILNLGYLWNTVRVKGGAYGVGMRTNLNGVLRMTSYRDPQAAVSLQVFKEAGEALRNFCNSDEPLDRHIISTLAGADPLLTPRMKGESAVTDYFTGRTDEDRQRRWREILHTTREQLFEYSKALDRMCEDAQICVVGGQKTMDACSGKIDRVESVQI